MQFYIAAVYLTSILLKSRINLHSVQLVNTNCVIQCLASVNSLKACTRALY